MNILLGHNSPPASAQQVKRFQGLITGLFQCCQERTHNQSQRFELPDAELRCLMLFKDERYLTPSGIAQKMNVVKSRITRLVSGLVRRGLIRKVKDPEDSRVILLTLTSKGAQQLKEIDRFCDKMYRLVLDGIPTEQRALMLNSLEALRGAMETARDLMD